MLTSRNLSKRLTRSDEFIKKYGFFGEKQKTKEELEEEKEKRYKRRYTLGDVSEYQDIQNKYLKEWSETGSVYILSDPHFEDADCKLMDPDWIMPEEQVARINALVMKNDTFVCLGA